MPWPGKKAFLNVVFVPVCFPGLHYTSQVGHGSELPDKLPDSYEDDKAFLKATHHVLLEVELVEGELECPDTGRRYPVSEGIPNMLLHEDEIQ